LNYYVDPAHVNKGDVFYLAMEYLLKRDVKTLCFREILEMARNHDQKNSSTCKYHDCTDKECLVCPAPMDTAGKYGCWKAYRDMIVHYRANPRSPDYMLERASEFISVHAKDASADLLVHKGILAEVQTKNYPWIRNFIADDELSDLNRDQYDTIVFLYADAIGMDGMILSKSCSDFHPFKLWSSMDAGVFSFWIQKVEECCAGEGFWLKRGGWNGSLRPGCWLCPQFML